MPAVCRMVFVVRKHNVVKELYQTRLSFTESLFVMLRLSQYVFCRMKMRCFFNAVYVKKII